MGNIHILAEKQTIAHEFLRQLRDRELQKDRFRFRLNLERLSYILAYEVSHYLHYKPIQIATPLGVAKGYEMEQPPVLMSVLRAALPMHYAFLHFFEQADNCFIGAYRTYYDKEHFDIALNYVATPNLTGKPLILLDPMLATGKTLLATFEKVIEQNGKPSQIFICNIIASQYAVDYLQSHLQFDALFTIAVDPDLTSKAYIVPGLGDAGDLAFGPKD